MGRDGMRPTGQLALLPSVLLATLLLISFNGLGESLAQPAVTRTPTLRPSDTGQIAIFKFMCDRVGRQDTCNGRDTSLSDYKVDFQVHQGEGTGGPVVQ